MRIFDLIIRNARLIDGTGAAAREGDLAVDGGRIVALGSVPDARAENCIDADGMALAPGFIDVHTHDDRALLATPAMPAKVSQGVTTVVTGNCGISLAPFPEVGRVPPPLDLIADSVADFFPRVRDYFGALAEQPPAVNVIALVGHTTLRAAAMGRLDRAATGSEIAAMRAALDRALEDGAAGLSTGLFYPPARASTTEEVIALAEPLRDHAGLYTTHLRDEGDSVIEALEEAFEIGRAVDAPVILSHHKVTNPRNHGRTSETLSLIDTRAREQPIGLDVYPYHASSTILVKERASTVERIMVTWSKARPEYAGRFVHEIAEELGRSREEVVDLLSPAGAVYFTMDEADVQRVLAFPHSMIGSDGLPHDPRPHPRLWGTFPRVLGHYVRDVGLFGVEEAVRRMTSLPAQQFGLRDRGVLGEGAVADLLLFDPTSVVDRATFEEPTAVSTGIAEVFVRGIPTRKHGDVTGMTPGRVLKRRGL